MDIVDLKQLMKSVLDHPVPPMCAIIRSKHTLSRLLKNYSRSTSESC
jgi:hypothetical protein